MAGPTRSAPHPAAVDDPLGTLARELYVALCARLYTAPGDKPQPKAVAQLAFRLAADFLAANEELNPTLRAVREARAKAEVDLDAVKLDFGAPARRD